MVIKFDLFELSDKNDGEDTKIKIILNSKTKPQLSELIDLIKTKLDLSTKEIAKQIGVSSDEFYTYIPRSKISLFALQGLIELYKKYDSKDTIKIKNEMLENTEFLVYGSGNVYKSVKCVTQLTDDMCWIVGGIVADGNLNVYTDEKGTGYRILVRDGYKDTMNILCDKIEKVFGFRPKLRYHDKEHHWYFQFKNKVVFRYLNIFFEIPYGKKSDIVKMPNMLRFASPKYRRAFISGVLIFDGGLNLRNGYQFFNSKSKQLVKDVANVLEEFGASPDYVSKKPHKTTGVWQLTVRRKEKLINVLKNFIEPNTIKFRQLETHLFGFEKMKSFNEVMKEMETLYPRYRDTYTLSDIVRTIAEHDKVNMKEVQEILGTKSHLIGESLNRLESWHVLKSTKEGRHKFWFVNENFSRR